MKDDDGDGHGDATQIPSVDSGTDCDDTDATLIGPMATAMALRFVRDCDDDAFTFPGAAEPD